MLAGELTVRRATTPVTLAIESVEPAGARFRARATAFFALFGFIFAWIAVSATNQPYLQIAAQMVIMGTGLGLTSTPATESSLSVRPPAKAGVGQPLMNEVITPWIRCGESGACRAMTSAAATEPRAAANAGAGSAWTGEAVSRLR